MTTTLPTMTPRRTDPREMELPNGLAIRYQTRTEALFFYEDIFAQRVYTRHGVTLDDVETVFDVGANIGLFTLFVARQRPGARIVSFEPVPALFEIASANAARYAPRAELVPRAVGAEPGEAEITFYTNSSGMSSLYADLEEERQALAAIMEHQRRRGMAGMDQVMRHADDLLDERFRAERVACRVTTVSRELAERGIERLDLLKVDVQKAEEDVILGIDDGDWSKIRQVVLEVHDQDGRLERMTEHLAARGFAVAGEQDSPYEGSIIHNLYAVRPQRRSGSRGSARTLPPVAGRMDRLARAVGADGRSAGGAES